MPERVRAVQHRRRLAAQSRGRVATGEQVAHERLAARNQLVGEHVPRTRLEPPLAEQRRELGRALGADGEVVLEDDRLSVEEKALARGRRIVEQLVDERDEPLPEALRGVIPLAIPVRVRDDVDVEQLVRACGVARSG